LLVLAAKFQGATLGKFPDEDSMVYFQGKHTAEIIMKMFGDYQIFNKEIGIILILINLGNIHQRILAY